MPLDPTKMQPFLTQLAAQIKTAWGGTNPTAPFIVPFIKGPPAPVAPSQKAETAKPAAKK